MKEEGKFTVLIADDNPDIHYLIKRMLKSRGYEFIDAFDGKEAISKIKTERPDIVLLDLRMPGMDGIEVLQEIKRKGLAEDTPILVLTVISDEDLKVKALSLGASDFLTKPPHPFELKARINTYLRLKKVTKDLRIYSEKLEKLVEEKTAELRKYVNQLEKMVEEKVGVIREQNEELQRSIKAAANVQKSLLPSNFPMGKYLSFNIKYLPCETIGGDFYDVFRIDEDNIGLFIADVSGHGVPSAMISIFLKQEISYRVKRIVEDRKYNIVKPAELLKLVNESFIQSNIGEGFFYITMVYANYNITGKELIISVAGHHALPILKRADGKTEVVKVESYPIGWFNGVSYEDLVYTLNPGDRLVLYTDGIFDVLCNSYENITLNKRVQMVENLLESGDINEKLDSLIADYLNREGKLNDDLTFMIMKILK